MAQEHYPELPVVNDCILFVTESAIHDIQSAFVVPEQYSQLLIKVSFKNIVILDIYE